MSQVNCYPIYRFIHGAREWEEDLDLLVARTSDRELCSLLRFSEKLGERLKRYANGFGLTASGLY